MTTPKKSDQLDSSLDAATMTGVALASALTGAAVYVAMSRWCDGTPACAGFVGSHVVRPGAAGVGRHAVRPGATRDSDNMPACKGDVTASWKVERDGEAALGTVADAHVPRPGPTSEQRAVCAAAQQEAAQAVAQGGLGDAVSARKRLEQCDAGNGGRRAVWKDTVPGGDAYRSALNANTQTHYAGHGIDSIDSIDGQS